MATIYVKARPGRRIVYEGKTIPEADFVPVRDTPYMRRLINHWQDVEQKGGDAPKPAPKPAPTTST